MSDETNNDEVECPKCGHVHDCSYEFFEVGNDHTEAECEECGATLSIDRDVSVKYYTRLAKVQP